MFEPRRKYETCIFCGSKELTDEHIFGAALGRAFPNKRNWKAFLEGRPRMIARKQVYTGGRPLLMIAPELACERCNTGPSSVVVKNALQPLMHLINGARRQLTPMEVTNLRRYWERVGVIIDVCTSNREITEDFKDLLEYQVHKAYRRDPPLISQEERARWLAGDFLPNVHVYLGHHPGVLGLQPETSIAPKFLYDHALKTLVTETKYFHMAIGSLAVIVAIGELSAEPQQSFADLSKALDGLQWPPRPSVSYEDFFHLYGPEDRVRKLLIVLRDRSTRRRIEKYSRKMGELTVPPDIPEPP